MARQEGLRGEWQLPGHHLIRIVTDSCLVYFYSAALLDRVSSVQAEGAKLRSDNETLQTCTRSPLVPDLPGPLD